MGSGRIGHVLNIKKTFPISVRLHDGVFIVKGDMLAIKRDAPSWLRFFSKLLTARRRDSDRLNGFSHV
jgi:hypothetical protein